MKTDVLCAFQRLLTLPTPICVSEHLATSYGSPRPRLLTKPPETSKLITMPLTAASASQVANTLSAPFNTSQHPQIASQHHSPPFHSSASGSKYAMTNKTSTDPKILPPRTASVLRVPGDRAAPTGPTRRQMNSSEPILQHRLGPA